MHKWGFLLHDWMLESTDPIINIWRINTSCWRVIRGKSCCAELQSSCKFCHLHFCLPFAQQQVSPYFFFFSTTTKQKIISSEASFLGEEHTTTFQNVYSCLDFSLQASSCPYSKAIFSFPCQRLLWPELALWACFINVTLTFTAQPHWHPDFALPIPSDARKPSGYAQTIYFGDMHWLWHSDRNEPQGREMTTSDPEKDELGLCQSSFSTEIRAGTAFPCHQAL